MFRIRRVYDSIYPRNVDAVAQVQKILAAQFPDLERKKIDRIPEELKNPLKFRFKSFLLVAEDQKNNVQGFALLSYASDLQYLFLDYLAAHTSFPGRGIGGALYQRSREEALVAGAVGIFFECLPDDPALSGNEKILKQNIQRLRFYEQYGARPVIHTKYETPVSPGGDNPPYLLYDNLGSDRLLRRAEARVIVRSILKRKYGDLCDGAYIKMVVDSFRDDPVLLREPKYLKKIKSTYSAVVPKEKRILIFMNRGHSVHHVHERGYVESPVRISSIEKEIGPTGLFIEKKAKKFPEKLLSTVHDPEYLSYFKKVCARLKPGKSVYPYVFPVRNGAKAPRELEVRAGYFCIDTFTPLSSEAFVAAKSAADCALSGAEALLAGNFLAYALVRPPGHHAERRYFGGFCYFNSAALAAEYLHPYGKVAILDIDYHHGNGQQEIFYFRDDVLTVSIHGDPAFAYPYFSGFTRERGEGRGLGFNANYPLEENTDGNLYRKTLEKALRKIKKFRPQFLVLCLGLDIAKGDPTGSWSLSREDIRSCGVLIGKLQVPTLITQEGGYNTRSMGGNARSFFTGLWEGYYRK